MNELFKTQEFADLAGVTVRTLHHYDRMGILKPQRSRSGYRLYSLRDLEKLEQITALKFLGLSLREIKALLSSSPLTLSASLRAQLSALTEQRERIDRAIHAIEAAEKLTGAGQPTDSAALRKIIEVIEMQPQEDFMRKYYSEEAWARRNQIRQQTPRETWKVRGEAWKLLFLDVEAGLELDPESDAAQDLARRWFRLVEAGSGGDPDVKAAGIEAWRDHRSWPESAQDAMLTHFGLDPNGDRGAAMLRIERAAQFIGRAMIRKY